MFKYATGIFEPEFKDFFYFLSIGSPNIAIARTFKLEVKFGVPLFTKLEPINKRF